MQDWTRGECEPVPGKTMPHLTVVERDYVNLDHRFSSLGPRLREEGVEDRGIDMPVADLYDEFAETRAARMNGTASAIRRWWMPWTRRTWSCYFAPETNGEVAYRGFEARERQVGLPLVDLAEENRGVRYDFEALTGQPRRILTSPCWSGIINDGRPYSAYCQNVERLIPWRTLTGRQHLYLDHEGVSSRSARACPLSSRESRWKLRETW